MVKRIISVFLAVTTLISLVGCKGEKPQNSGKIKIVTTLFPLYDFTREIVGDKAEVSMLLPFGAEPHSYEPTISDIATINTGDLIVYIGGESDIFLEKVETSGEVLKLSEVADTYPLKDIAANTGDGFSEHHHDHEHTNKLDFDEHIWLSPKNAQKMVDSILEKVLELDKENAEFYKHNAKKYKRSLQILDEGFDSINKQKPIIVADRFPFGYLLHDYSLNFLAAINGCTSDSEPTVNTMKFLMDTIKAQKIDTVFTIEFSPMTVAKRLQKECGVKIKTLYSMQSISKSDFENGESYISLMNKNLELLKEVD